MGKEERESERSGDNGRSMGRMNEMSSPTSFLQVPTCPIKSDFNLVVQH